MIHELLPECGAHKLHCVVGYDHVRGFDIAFSDFRAFKRDPRVIFAFLAREIDHAFDTVHADEADVFARMSLRDFQKQFAG